jgi:hypothetical protein
VEVLAAWMLFASTARIYGIVTNAYFYFRTEAFVKAKMSFVNLDTTGPQQETAEESRLYPGMMVPADRVGIFGFGEGRKA